MPRIPAKAYGWTNTNKPGLVLDKKTSSARILDHFGTWTNETSINEYIDRGTRWNIMFRQLVQQNLSINSMTEGH